MDYSFVDESNAQDLIKHLANIYDDLLEIRNHYEDVWLDIKKLFLPRKGRALTSSLEEPDDAEMYDRLNSTALNATRKFSHGMYSNMTHPSTTWFRAHFGEAAIDNKKSVKIWLDKVTKLMHKKLSNSNFYQMMKSAFQELGTFGTFFVLVEYEYNDKGSLRFKFTPFTTGTYCIDQGFNGVVDTVFHEENYKAHQLVQKFGCDHLPDSVKRAYDNKDYKNSFPVIHAVYPRNVKNEDVGKRGQMYKKYASVYYMKEESSENALLGISGYDTFPGCGPRWDTTANDSYGLSPAMDASGDAQMLEMMEKDLLKAIHKEINPPVNKPDKSPTTDLNPDGENVYNPVEGSNQNTVKPVYQIQANIRDTEFKIQRTEEKINETMYVNLFQVLSTPHPQKTAYEVAEIKQEKLMMIGPAIERLQNELLIPILNIEFEKLLEAGEIPAWPEPELLAGKDLKMEFTSVLAQTQKAAQTAAKDRIVGLILQLGQVFPDAYDNLNVDKLIENYADAIGLPAEEINSEDIRAQIRNQRQTMQMNQMMANQAKDMASAGKTASEIPVGEDMNMLESLLKNTAKRSVQ